MSDFERSLEAVWNITPVTIEELEAFKMKVKWVITLFPAACSVCDKQARWRSTALTDGPEEHLCDTCLSNLTPEARGVK